MVPKNTLAQVRHRERTNVREHEHGAPGSFVGLFDTPMTGPVVLQPELPAAAGAP